jgi:hypothetical protein
MNKTFTSASFDLSSTPDVVWALPPTIDASLHNAAFTLRTVKGSRPPNPPSQPLHSPHKETFRNNKFILGSSKNKSTVLVRDWNMIDSYGFGRITINGKRYTNDVIVFSDRVKDNWWRKEGHRLQVEDIETVVKQKPEVLVVGTGYYGLVKIPVETIEYLKSKGVKLIAQKHGKPVQRTTTSWNRGKK